MKLDDWLDTKLQKDIWRQKYQNDNETFEEWLDRVSNRNEEIKRLIKEKKFLFGGRILANRGVDKSKLTYSNCYVLKSPEDNLEDIYRTAYETAKTFSYGGGVGFNLSKLSPRGATIHNAAKTTTGAVSFMDLYNTTSALIGQNNRRGALMLCLNSNHPDIEEFIDIKKDLNKINKANISIMMMPSFWKAYTNHSTFYDAKFYRPESDQIISKQINADDFLNHIAQNNWEMGEPGMLFYDNINDYHLMSDYDDFNIFATNPCGEQPLINYDSCLLGSMNLSEYAYLKDDKYCFDFSKFFEDVQIVTHEMNKVQAEGADKHPLKQQRNVAKKYRRIGIGIMGLADLLIKLGIKYSSTEAENLCDKIGEAMLGGALLASAYDAKENTPFDTYDYDLVSQSEFYQHFIYDSQLVDTSFIDSEVQKYGLYNSALLSIAPTGSISTMLGISGGIEPIYDLSYTRKTESLNNDDTYYKVYTPIVEKYMNKHNIDDEKDLPSFFETAKNINYNDRLHMQQIWQKWIDSGISSTVNLPEKTTVEEIKNLYIEAHTLGLKGITVFRDNCYRTGILTSNDKTNKEKHENNDVKSVEPVKVNSNNVIGKKRKIKTGCGNLHCLSYFDKETGRLLEVYLGKGSQGGCQGYMTGLSRMISLAARSGCDIDEIVDQLQSVPACPSYVARHVRTNDTSKGSSCPTAIGYALTDMFLEMQSEIDKGMYDETFLTDENKSKQNEKEIDVQKSIPKVKQVLENKDKPLNDAVPEDMRCPDCGAVLIKSGGCIECKSCGWSKCN